MRLAARSLPSYAIIIQPLCYAFFVEGDYVHFFFVAIYLIVYHVFWHYNRAIIFIYDLYVFKHLYDIRMPLNIRYIL